MLGFTKFRDSAEFPIYRGNTAEFRSLEKPTNPLRAQVWHVDRPWRYHQN